MCFKNGFIASRNMCACEFQKHCFQWVFRLYNDVALRDVTNLCLLNTFLSFSQSTVSGRHGATGYRVTSAAAVATRAGHVTATRRCTEVKVAAAARRRRGKTATRTTVPVGGAVENSPVGC